MSALDTNVLIRYIMNDDIKQSSLAAECIESFSSDNQAFISCVVLCEINWVLKSAYNISKEDIIKTLYKIIMIAHFKIEHIDCCLQALKLWQKGTADFSDYLIQEIAKSHGHLITFTFDKKALKSTGFKVPIGIVNSNN